MGCVASVLWCFVQDVVDCSVVDVESVVLVVHFSCNLCCVSDERAVSL